MKNHPSTTLGSGAGGKSSPFGMCSLPGSILKGDFMTVVLVLRNRRRVSPERLDNKGEGRWAFHTPVDFARICLSCHQSIPRISALTDDFESTPVGQACI